MVRLFFLFLMVIGVGVYAPVVVYAADAPTAEAADQEENVKTVRERVRALTKDLSDAERTHFYAIYDSHNLINVAKSVQDSVADGVKKCAENNPDMKDALKARHKDWKASVDEVLKEAEGNVKNMISVQDYIKPRDIKKVLKFVDKVRKDTEVQKVPVTSPEACEYLLNKMDETEDNLTGLLRSTLVSLPQALQNAQEADKEAAEEKAADEKK